MMRIVLFLFTNIAVIIVFGLVLNLIGLQSKNIQNLLFTALFFGFSGSLISLLISKWIAIQSVDGDIIKQPRNDIEQWLIDTVSKQAKQTKIGIPDVMIYHSLDINAFATGASRNSSLIAVSTCLLKDMNQDEATAVIAHEISHIANGDMVTMTLIQGIVNTFVIFTSRIIAQIIAGFLSWNQNNGQDDKEEKGGSSMIYFFVATILELVFGILANIITLWFSRHREFYADAGSAELVGREKMIAALQRLKISYEPQEENKMISTFYINGKSQSLNKLFMTHPTLDQRIEALRIGKYLK